MRRVVAIVGLTALLGGCGGDARESPPGTAGATGPSSSESPAGGATPVRDCDTGDLVDYPVPNPEATYVLGCAKLDMSDRVVQFNGEPGGRVAGREIFCIGLAPDRRPVSSYLSNGCPNRRPPHLDIRSTQIPRPPSDGWGLIVWGTAPAASGRVKVRWADEQANAAVFDIEADFANRFGAEPFALFIAELPRTAACSPLVAAAAGRESKPELAARVCQYAQSLDS